MSSDDLQVHMTGSEWFSSRPGGLARYFTDLYLALRDQPKIHVTGAAFGEAPAGGQSWGLPHTSTLRRVYLSLVDPADLPRGTIVDRHFCLYGRPVMSGRRHVHPLVVHFHGPWYQEALVAGARGRDVMAKYWFERFRYGGADRFVVLSDCFREILTSDYRVSRDRIEVIPPGVDLHRFRYRELNPASQTALCVRRLERRMGIDVLIDAWRYVNAAHPDATLTIVGKGTEASALRAQVVAAGLEKSISFAGSATDDELEELYGQAAFTIVPSTALEGFGMIVLESLAVGRAPIVSDCGGLPDSVRSFDSSLIVPMGNVDALAERIISALDGAIPAPRRCREHAEKFSWESAAERHIAMYRNLVW